MDSEEKYKEYSKKVNDIIEKYKTRLDELNSLRNEMFKRGMTYDSKEIKESLHETRKIYMEQEKLFYDLLHDVTNYLNSENNEKIEILQKFKFLRNEIQFNYYQCFAERTKIENQTNFHNTAKLSSFAEIQHSKVENLIEDQKEHDKKILEIMGVFLSIFSLIGVNLSFFSNIKDVSVWNILLLVIVINVSLSKAIKVIFSVIRKEKVETIAEKIFKTIVNCIKEKTK